MLCGKRTKAGIATLDLGQGTVEAGEGLRAANKGVKRLLDRHTGRAGFCRY